MGCGDEKSGGHVLHDFAHARFVVGHSIGVEEQDCHGLKAQFFDALGGLQGGFLV